MRWTLFPLALLWGAVLARVSRRFWDAAGAWIAVNRMVAHVLEFRLFLDEPALVLRAQADLLRANGRLLRAIALPAAIAAIPFVLAYPGLDRWYGYGPLPIGKAAVVTVKSGTADLELRVPEGVVVESPAVRSIHTGESSWRVRPLRPFTGRFEAVREGRAIETALYVPVPRASLAGMPWMVWFCLVMTAGARLFA